MKQVLSLFLLCVMTAGAYAQDGNRRKEKKEAIKAKKIAYLTQAIELSPDEAEKFWPLYNQKNEEERQAKKELKPNFEKGDLERLSEAEIEVELKKGLQLQERLLGIQRKYFDEFKEVITVRQIARLHKAEKNFKRTLLEEYKKREGGPGQRGPDGNRF